MATGSSDRANAIAVFGNHNRKSRSPQFAGGTLVAVFGDVAFDVQEARPAPVGARIRAVAIFGDVEIVVPRGWTVEVGGASILGDVKDQTAAAESADAAPRLNVGGLALLGDIVVRHAT